MANGSLFLSIEVILVLLIFVSPKLLEKSEDQDSTEALPELFVNASGMSGGSIVVRFLYTSSRQLFRTVIFADIAGFTAWSSTRDPQTVFQFLEAVFGAFDEIAEKRKVFKVETVGDCYGKSLGQYYDDGARSRRSLSPVVIRYSCRHRYSSWTVCTLRVLRFRRKIRRVTGSNGDALHKPTCFSKLLSLLYCRADHAVVMARFAIDCMNCMHRITKDLVVTYFGA
jgi:hypothetical protein